MAELKTVGSWGPYTISSDARDVLVDGSKDFEVMSWCHKQGILADIYLKVAGGESVWRIKDDEQRTLFLLRWS